MVLEAISFKLTCDFFTYLSKNRITANTIRLGFYDRKCTEFTSFSNLKEIADYYDNNYKIIDCEKLGSLVSIVSFKGLSDLYDFRTEYTAHDVIGNFKLVSGSTYDRQRNTARKLLCDRQVGLLNKGVEEYLGFFNELKRIYATGIYSQCYAIPGWSQNTYLLNSLKDAIVYTRQNSQFPYANTPIEREPPN